MAPHSFKTLAGGLNAESFLDRCYLKGHEFKLIRSYSSGMKQRLNLGLALMSESPVLFLDEPQSKLDDRAKSRYQELLRERATGRIILIASNEADDFKMVDEVITLASPSR